MSLMGSSEAVRANDSWEMPIKGSMIVAEAAQVWPTAFSADDGEQTIECAGKRRELAPIDASARDRELSWGCNEGGAHSQHMSEHRRLCRSVVVECGRSAT